MIYHTWSVSTLQNAYLTRMLCGVSKLNPPEQNMRSHSALEGRGVFSSIAKFLNGAYRPW